MDELAYSLNGENAHYGTPLNAAAPGRIPGGSSSGSAVGKPYTLARGGAVGCLAGGLLSGGVVVQACGCCPWPAPSSRSPPPLIAEEQWMAGMEYRSLCLC